jgi:Kef-type K+ transport system membrane component KefB
MIATASEIQLVGLLLGLFILPRFLQRFRVPGAVTSFVLGGVVGPGFGHFTEDSTVQLLSTFGIVALFLCAGMDVCPQELRSRGKVLLEHVASQVVVSLGVFYLASEVLGLGPEASLLALALVTPSCGFILDSLNTLGLSSEERAWVRSKAISTELVALGAMFVILQSASWLRLAGSTLVLVGMVFFLPVALRAFARWIVPHAPRTEFAFLIILAVVCALVTRRLGVYYLLGAFVVGMAAKGLREQLPAMASERMMHSVEAFASLFIPFYFFHAGLSLRPEDLGFAAWGWGLTFVIAIVPVRVAMVAFHRLLRGEPFRAGLRIGLPLAPTLVFTLVLAEILRQRFDLPPALFGGLVVYALGSTLMPGFLLRAIPFGPEPERSTDPHAEIRTPQYAET